MCKKTKMKDSLTANDDFIYWALLKKIGLYYIINPNGWKILKFNGFQLILISCLFIQQCILIYGLLGYYIITTGETHDHINNMLAIFGYTLNYISVVQASIFMYYSNEIWKLFAVTSNNFLTSKHCRKYLDIHIKYEKLSKKIIYPYCVLIITAFLFWIVFPPVLYIISFGNVNSDNTTNGRFVNIFNYRTPFTVDTYNRYFLLFYIAELSNSVFVTFTHTSFFVFINIFGFVFIAQYEVIAQAFADVGNDDQIAQKDNKTNSVQYFWNGIKQIVIDQQKLYLKLKSFFSIIWIGMYLFIGLESLEIIIVSYTTVMAIVSVEMTSISIILQLVDTFMLYCFELIIMFYIMDTLIIKKESGSHGMYSSNWSYMDLKTKKKLLLAMRMEDANKLMCKISPDKMINLQLFASVMKISYNVVSVMLKSINK